MVKIWQIALGIGGAAAVGLVIAKVAGVGPFARPAEVYVPRPPVEFITPEEYVPPAPPTYAPEVPEVPYVAPVPVPYVAPVPVPYVAPVPVPYVAPAPTYTVTVSPTTGGTVTGGGSYNSGATVILTATPSSGYQFSSWSGDVTGTSNPAQITMPARDITAVANFTVIPVAPPPLRPLVEGVDYSVTYDPTKYLGAGGWNASCLICGGGPWGGRTKDEAVNNVTKHIRAIHP